MKAVSMFVAYTSARSFYAYFTLVLIWGSLYWTPLGTLCIVLLVVHLVTRVEEVPFLEGICRRLRIEGPLRASPRLLSHGEDIHLLIFLAVLILDYLSAFYVYLNFDRLVSPNLSSKVCFVFGVGTMLGWTAGINLGVVFHNHLHRGVFRSAGANRWIGRLWTIPSGWPSYFWQYKHVAVHHKHVGKTRDWVQPRTSSDGRYESIYRYILCHWPWRYAWHLWIDFTGDNKRRNRRALIELLMFLPFWAVPFVLDPVMGIGLWLYPLWFGSAFILGTGMYTQHAGGTSKGRHSGSTTFLSEFFNLTMFNVGHHTEHHSNPSAHWSELPDLHQRMRDELVTGGAHVVPYGSYRAGSLLSSIFDRKGAFDEFRKQHPDYVVAPPVAVSPVLLAEPGR